MSALDVAWAASLIAAGWFLAVGTVRMLAYRSGQVDHDKGMERVAQMTLALGAVSVAALVVLTVLIARR